MKRMGIFGGTFDPIHLGHLQLAAALKEFAQLEKVFFSPNFFSPAKKGALPVASPIQRFEMVSLAIEGMKGFYVLDYEISHPGPSYTIDLIRYVKSSLSSPEDQIFLLLGKDVGQGFSQWKEWQELLHLTTPLLGSKSPPPRGSPLEKSWVEVQTLAISSTAIREMLKKGECCKLWVPASVLDYIRVNKLY